MKERIHAWLRERWHPENRPVTATAAYYGVWMLLWLDWLAWHQLPDWFKFTGFVAGLYPLVYWARRARSWSTRHQRMLWTAMLFPAWHLAVYVPYAFGWNTLSAGMARLGLMASFVVGLAWTVWWVEKESRRFQKQRAATLGGPSGLKHIGPLAAMHQSIAPPMDDDKLWHPADLDAWYYGAKHKKLNQSVTTTGLYALAYLLLFLFITGLAGCREIYEMPAGGGEQAQLQQLVKVQKVIKKKFIINPLSAVLFNPPPIEDVPLQLMEVTKHAYQVGFGKGEGAGFSGGTNRGKVRFIRLEYSGGDWDQDFGVGADLNMLIEYNVRTSHKVESKTESRKVAQLKNFPVGKSPPFVYMTGQKNISLSKSEIKILREYVTTKHGMIFADNGGSRAWGDRFKNLMHQVLPQVERVRIPLDHPIHRVPYPIPVLPYVAPHDGKDAYGWVIDGRLAAYYHPGDIGDAWADGHAGVKTEIWELCYQLGVNIIFYAHAEYNRWLDMRDKAEKE